MSCCGPTTTRTVRPTGCRWCCRSFAVWSVRTPSIADQACVALNPTYVGVDVEQFLLDVSDAVALQERGLAADARVLLTEAVHRYTDEPFADAPYDDETSALRDEARAAYHQALRLLAEYCQTAGENDRAGGLPAPAARG